MRCRSGWCKQMKILAIDIGGSSIKSCIAEKTGDTVNIITPVSRDRLHTSKIYEIKEIILSLCEKYHNEKELPVIGIATAGSVDTNEVVVKAGNFVDYLNVSWSEIIQEKYPDAIVTTANDGRSSAWGEYLACSEKSTSHVHAVIGTGVGGGIIHRGELLLGESGQAGYIGHIKVLLPSEGVRVCGCGSTGCVETMASARAVVSNYIEICENRKLSNDIDFGSLIDSFDKDPENIIKALHASGNWLGIALGNVMNAINPKTITLGGGGIVAIEKLIIAGKLQENPYLIGVNDGIKYAAHRRVAASGTVKIGVLGNDAGLVGIANLAADKADKLT